MAQNIPSLTGTVGAQITAGTIVEGTIVTISKGTAVDFMTAVQCAARKTDEKTRYINLEIAMGEHGIKNKSFPDYSNPEDPDMPINPNSIHGKVIATYPELKVEDTINMIASKKETQNGSLMVWDMVLV
ncbi:hypothetical protein KAX97_05235 [candidate division WOR-3 bacterium]|nr:hypothetical protein [candidate division WOR-3 bacterium]